MYVLFRDKITYKEFENDPSQLLKYAKRDYLYLYRQWDLFSQLRNYYILFCSFLENHMMKLKYLAGLPRGFSDSPFATHYEPSALVQFFNSLPRFNYKLQRVHSTFSAFDESYSQVNYFPT